VSANRLESRMQSMLKQDFRGLAPYLTAGDGGMETTLAVLEALDAGGASCIELGIPFSDPIADGPVLQAASQRALDSGTTLDSALEMLAEFRSRGCTVPVAIMSYANPLHARGWAGAARAVADAGGDALIVPDLPVEEGGGMAEAAGEAGLCPIFFASPTSGDDRIARAASESRGFLYVVGRTGITGARTSFDETVQSFLKRAESLSPIPLGVGFGISTGDDVREAVRYARLAIVGTALVQRLHEAGPGGAREAASLFLEELMTGVAA